MPRFIPISLLASLLAANSAFAQDDGLEAKVVQLYQPYIGTDLAPAKSTPPDSGEAVKKLASARFRALLQKDEDCAAQSHAPCQIDGNLVLDAQEWKIAGVTAHMVNKSDDKASVEADFSNYDHPQHVTYLFVRESGDWKIDDVVWFEDGADKKISEIIETPIIE